MNKKTYKFPKKTIRDIPIHGKTVLVRADFNVPLDEKGNITSDYRITQTIPTIEYLLSRKCRVIITSHLGRPEGKKNLKYSLKPVFKRLQELLPNIKIEFAQDAINDSARILCKQAEPGEIVLLENVRFYPEEEANDPSFANKLKTVTGAEYFVQDGFGVVHRAHASTEAIAHLLPSVAGLLLDKEVSTLVGAMHSPDHPLVSIVGGAKISDKIEFIEELLKISENVLIGGAMANIFLKYQGKEIGKSLFEEGQEEKIESILKKAKPGQLVLPTDVAVSKEIATTSQRRDCSLEEVEEDDIILDLGFETMRQFTHLIQSASTIIWNGTLGMAELSKFAQGSDVLAKSISDQAGAVSIIGGGDTADFVLGWLEENPDGHFTHISTGGGASLELMSGQKLPGVEALLDK